MSRRILDFDPLTSTTTYHDYDHSTKQTIITEVQDVEKYLERNKKLANDTQYKKDGIKSDWYHFASVPNGVMIEIMQKYNVDWRNDDDLPKIERILSSNEYRYLRTVDKI